MDFEENFVKQKSKMPKTFFIKSKIEVSTEQKAMIFALHYIGEKKSAAKHVKLFSKKNSSFRAFALNVDDILQRLTNLGFLSVESRIKRRRVLNELAPRVQEVRIEVRRERFFKIHYRNERAEHVKFLDMYQTIYPGELIGS